MDPPPPPALRPNALPALPKVDPSNAAVRSRVEAPVKRIQDDTDLEYWAGGKAHSVYLLFVARLAHACRGKPTRVLPDASTQERTSVEEAARVGPCEGLLALLDEIDSWTREIEPLKTPQRFGNLAFRDWGRRLEDRIDGLHSALLPDSMHPFIVELRAYLCDSFGSFVRLDYGSGHELAFCAWLCGLTQLGFLTSDSATEERLALEVYPRYLAVAWALQDRYGLEPAGSHGVWGLDDFHFLSYVFGAAQLENEKEYPPTAIATSSHRPSSSTPLSPHDLLDFMPSRDTSQGVRQLNTTGRFQDPIMTTPPFRNLYTSSIARIHSLKRGPFAEHSPILSDIAGSVPSWHKVASGMLKMYDEEVLKKRPVVQHFFFGPTFFVWDRQSVQHGSSTDARAQAKSQTVQAARTTTGSGPPAAATGSRRAALPATGAPWAAQPATGAPWAQPATGAPWAQPATGAPWAASQGVAARGTGAPWARQSAMGPKS